MILIAIQLSPIFSIACHLNKMMLGSFGINNKMHTLCDLCGHDIAFIRLRSAACHQHQCCCDHSRFHDFILMKLKLKKAGEQFPQPFIKNHNRTLLL